MADYTQKTQDKILDFINKAQNKIASLSNDLAHSLDEIEQNPEYVQIPIGLLDFIESLLSPHLDWPEDETIDLIDFWIEKAELSHIAYLQLSNYQMPRVTFTFGEGITQAQLDAVNAASIGRDNALQADIDTNTADILGLGAILPIDFYNIHDTSDVNVWNDDIRLHTHANKADIDAIDSNDITNINKLTDHFSNNTAGEKHITDAERINWNGRLQGITSSGASITIDVVDPINPILTYVQQSIAISDVILLQATLTDLQDQINSIPAGATGATPVIAIGTVTSGPDETPNVAISGTPENPVMDFTLKDGIDGTDGSDFIIDARGTSLDRLDDSFNLKTFADTDVDIATNYITLANHGYYDGMRLQFSGADLPDPLNDYDIYYVSVVNINEFTVSLDKSGISLDILDQGTGIHSIFPVQDFTYLGSNNGLLYFRLDPATYPDATLTTGWSSGIQIIGEDGWSPLFSLYTSGVNIKVIQLIDWIGGSGNRPSPDPLLGVPYYLGASGWTTDIGAAINIQGPGGESGDKGDMFFPSVEGLTADRSNYDTEAKDFVFLDTELGFVYKKNTDISADWSAGFQWIGDDGIAGTPGVPEAPIDTQEYVRKDATWVVNTGGISQLDHLTDVVGAINLAGNVLVANGTTGYEGRALLEADISDFGSYAAASHNHAWGDITSGVPTTIAGYGITDAYTKAETDALTWDWLDIVSGIPTTMAGYGISDTKANFNTALSDGDFMFNGDVPSAHTHGWSDIISGVPTTLSGYGIIDAYTKVESDANYWGVEGTTTLINPTIIQQAANSLDFRSNVTTTRFAATFSDTSGFEFIYNLSGLGKYLMQINSSQALLGFGVSQFIRIQDGDMNIFDTDFSRGLRYGGDYSINGIATHGDLWIPHKGYNDSAYQPIGTYDNYVSWNLKTNGVQKNTISSGGDLDLVGGTDISTSYSAGGIVTIAYTGTVPPATDYWKTTGATSLTGNVDIIGDSHREIKFYTDPTFLDQTILSLSDLGVNGYKEVSFSLRNDDGAGGFNLVKYAGAGSGGFFQLTSPEGQQFMAGAGTTGIKVIDSTNLDGLYYDVEMINGFASNADRFIGDTGFYDGRYNPLATGTPDGTKFLRDDNTWQVVGAGGDISTDIIWDAKGDLAVGTGNNVASRLATGIDGYVLTAASGEVTGLAWAQGITDLNAQRSESGIAYTTLDSDKNTTVILTNAGTVALTLESATKSNGYQITILNDTPNNATISVGTDSTIQGGTINDLLPGEYFYAELVSTNVWSVIVADQTAGLGDVFKVGLPVNNQIGVWTGDGTLKGDPNFTWNGNNMSIGGDLNFSVSQSPLLFNVASSSTIPTFMPNNFASNSGLGGTGTGVICLISNSINSVNVASTNIGLVGASDYAGGTGIIAIKDRISIPGLTPSGGAIFYSEAGLPKWKDSAGVTYTLTDLGTGDVATDVIWNAAADLAVGTGADTATILPKGTGLQVLRMNAGATAIEWGAATGGGDVSTDVIWDTKGDLAVATAADTAIKLGVGTDGYVLTADSVEATGLIWSAVVTELNAQRNESGTTYSTQDSDKDTTVILTAVSAVALTLESSTKSIGYQITILNNTNSDATISKGTDSTIQGGVIPDLVPGGYFYAELISTNTWSIVTGEVATGGNTNLSMGLVDGTQYIIESSDGDNVSLPLATAITWGIISDEIFNNIVANNAKVSDINHNVTTDLTWDSINGHIESSDGTDADIGMFSLVSNVYGFVPGTSGVASTNYLDASGTWSVPVGTIGGTIGVGQLAYGVSTDTLTGTNNLLYAGSELKMTSAGVVKFNINTTIGASVAALALSRINRRWEIGFDGTTESGSDVGSNFQINRHNDAGTFIETAFAIERSTGTIILGTNTNLLLFQGTTDFTIGTIDAADLILKRDNIEGLRVGVNGHVSISQGNGTPASASDLNYIFSVHRNSTNAAFIHITNDTTGTNVADGFIFGIDDLENIQLRGSTDTNEMIFYTNNVERIVIPKAGIGAGGSDDLMTWNSTTHELGWVSQASVGSVTGSGTNNQLALWNGTDALDALAAGTDTNVLTMVAGIPTWQSSSGGGAWTSSGGYTLMNTPGDNVGINQATPTFKLDVTGTIRATSTITATNFLLSSDIRDKVIVEQLGGNDYKYFSFNRGDEPLRYGVSAQQVQKINPELVITNPDGKLTVSYIDLMIKEIARLTNEVNELKAK